MVSSNVANAEPQLRDKGPGPSIRCHGHPEQIQGIAVTPCLLDKPAVGNMLEAFLQIPHDLDDDVAGVLVDEGLDARPPSGIAG